MTLDEAFTLLAPALAPLGIEIEQDVLDVWRDRSKHDAEPIPADALKQLAAVADRIAEAGPR